MDELDIFNKLKIGVASDEKIREWSKGEVKKPETIYSWCNVHVKTSSLSR